MGAELKQGSAGGATPEAAFVDDRFGANLMHMQANSRVLTTLIGVISQTSPGVITGLGGDTTMSLPGGAVPINLSYYGLTQASTGATISVGLDTTSGYFLNSQQVNSLLNGKNVQNPQNVLNLFTALAALPVGQAHAVTGFYSETATSGSGGPWYVQIDYYRPLPA